MKNYIDIYDENDNKKQMEVVAIFKLDGYDFNYIIYSELDKSHYYIGKYKGEEIVDLNTDLSNQELVLCNKVLKAVLEDARD